MVSAVSLVVKEQTCCLEFIHFETWSKKKTPTDFHLVLTVLLVEENGAVDSEFCQDVFGDETDWIPCISEEVAAFPDTPVSRSSITVFLKVGKVI